MKKIGLFLLLGIVLFAISAYCEDHWGRGLGIVVGLVSICLGLVVGDETEGREFVHDSLKVIGQILMALFVVLSLLLEVHVETDANDMAVVRSRFYTKVLARGRIETQDIDYAYRMEYGAFDGIEMSEFYFIYTEPGRCAICNRFEIVMQIDTPFIMTERDFGHGPLQLIVDKNGNVFDFEGTPVTADYSPILIDRTVPEPSV